MNSKLCFKSDSVRHIYTISLFMAIESVKMKMRNEEGE